MAESNVNIMLDTVRRNRISVIYAVENDYGARFITAAIMTDGKKKAVKKTAVVTINAERPDGQRKAFEGSVNEDGTVKVPVTQWMLEFEGEVVCSVSIVTSTSRLTTTHFYIQAQYSVWDGTSAPSADDPDKDVIVSIVAAENERVANENARISAENTRRTAETARIDAENTRIANESVRVSNEAERVSAESVRKTEFATWQGEIGKISAFDKRIENLEVAVNPGLVSPMIDDAVAYVKDVPTGALPYASVSEVGGMTYNVNGVLRDAKVTAVESVGANLFGGDTLADVLVTKCNGVKDKVNKTVSYQPWNVSKVVLYDKFKANTQYTFFLRGYNEENGVIFANLAVKYTDGTDDTLNFYEGIVYYVSKAEKTIKSFKGNWNTGKSVLYYSRCGIFEGNVMRENFVPYFKNTFAIPEAVQALEGYGQGISKEYHNKIVLDPASGVKRFVKNVGEVDLGTLDWELQDSGRFLSKGLQKPSKLYNALNVGIGLCENYNIASWSEVNTLAIDKGIALSGSSVYVSDTAYTDAETFKAAMQGVMLLYELATPVETDVSDYFGEDNLIGVEGGGTVTMVNEYEYDVPSVIEYTVKGVDAI